MKPIRGIPAIDEKLGDDAYEYAYGLSVRSSLPSPKTAAAVTHMPFMKKG